MVTSLVHGLLTGDTGFYPWIVMVPLFGWPFVLGLLLVAAIVYLLARRANVVSKRFTITTGVILGGIIGIIARMPLLPVWAAAVIGGLAGAVWWRVARVDRPVSPAA